MAGPDIESRFGKYRLLDRIATGGMAEIYRARYQAAAGVSKPVVIKKILPAFSGNRGFVSMFINEAKIAAGLSHGNIAHVFDFGEIDGEYFIAMEYVPGHPLSQVLQRARATGMPSIPVPYACLIGVELCKGLHYAHTRADERGRPLGIVHRDVSPQNVLLSYEGQVKIVDFGIAKARHASAAESDAGAVQGKYVYFSPEQARGKELDARTDIFSAGIVLFELLCGRPPFEGKMVEVMNRIVRGEFDPPREANPALPGELEQILLTALSTDRNTRYHSAQELGDALSAFLARHHPGVSTHSLGHLMSVLFEPELAAEGLSVRVPREFQRELEALRGLPPGVDDERTVSDRERVTPGGTPAASGGPAASSPRAARASGPRTAAPEPLVVPPGAVVTPMEIVLGRPPRWLYLALPLIAAVLAVFAVLLVGLREAELRVTSSPPGARVIVDGVPLPELTPAVVPGLAPDQPHTVRIEVEGLPPLERQVTPTAGEVLSIHADLRALATAKDTAP